MSYDISLVDPLTKKVCVVDVSHFMRGGTFQVGGSKELLLNVTYNYSEILGRVLKGGIDGLYGMTGGESILVLERAIEKLGDVRSRNYWDATEGNVKLVLMHLLSMAKLRPDGIWEGD